MKKTKRITQLFSTLALLGLSQLASAGNLCSTDIMDAKADIELYADGFLSKNADRDISGLLGKLSAADGNLDKGKTDGARQKINDALYKLDQLASAGKPKINDETYEVVTGSISAVMTCINENYL